MAIVTHSALRTGTTDRKSRRRTLPKQNRKGGYEFMSVLPKAEYLEHHMHQLGWVKVTYCKDCQYYSPFAVLVEMIEGWETEE